MSLGSSNEESAYLIFQFTDDEAVLHAINKQSCEDKHLMYFVKKLVLMCLEKNIFFRANVRCKGISVWTRCRQIRPYICSHRFGIAAIMSRLLLSRLQSSSMPTYTRSWKLFCKLFMIIIVTLLLLSASCFHLQH